MISEDLYTVLTGAAAVSALVSTRVYPLYLPQNATYPCISYTVEEQEEDSSFDGQGDFGSIEIQIDSWADAYLASQGLAAAVKGVLKNHSGMFGATQVWQIKLVAAVTVFEETAGQDGKFRTSQIYTLYR